MTGDDRSDPFSDMINLFAAPLAGTIRSFDQFRKGVDEFLRGVENFNRTMENLNETAERINVLLAEVEEPIKAAIPRVTRAVKAADEHDAGGQRAGHGGCSRPHPTRRDPERTGVQPAAGAAQPVHRGDDRDVEAPRAVDPVRRVGGRSVRWISTAGHVRPCPRSAPPRADDAGQPRGRHARANGEPRAAGARQKAPAKKTAVKKAPAKKRAPAKKSAAKKRAPAKKSAAKKAPAPRK